MKLKKIASLMLAGIMAVSMLTACDTTSNGDSNDDDVIVTPPTDTSFAAAVNGELSGPQKAVITFGSDSTLASVLKSVADELKTSYVDNTKIGIVAGNYDDSEDFRHLLGLGAAKSFTARGGSFDTSLNNNDGQWTYFNTNVTTSETLADLIVVPGNLTEEGVAEKVASFVGNLIDNRMPNDNGATAGDKYVYDYTGDIAVVKVTSLSGDYSAYVVGLTVTQTATKVTRVYLKTQKRPKKC